MIPLVDIHVHLLAGLDDGPSRSEEALAMCRMAYEEGVRLAAATAHQNDHYRGVTPERIRKAHCELTERLRLAEIPLSVFPCAEVMIFPELLEGWTAGRLLSVADRGHYLLIEMPHGLMLDLRHLLPRMKKAGIRPILAHPERYPGLLHEAGQVEQLIQQGCLIQVSADSITHPRSNEDWRALKDWLKRDIVHLLGSDGHDPQRRPPRMLEAYRALTRHCGQAKADRICSTHGMAILQGLPLKIPEPQRPRKWWFLKR